MKTSTPNLFTAEGVEKYLANEATIDPAEVLLIYPTLKVLSNMEAFKAMGYTPQEIADTFTRLDAERKDVYLQVHNVETMKST